MKTKICTKCKEEKTLDLFYRDKTKKDGLSCSCKECIVKKRIESDFDRESYNKKYYHENKKYFKKKRKERYFKNKEDEHEYSKTYYQNNKNKFKNYREKWLKENKEIKRELDFLYYQKNKDKIKTYKKNFNKSPLKWDSKSNLRREIELYEEIKESSNGNVECKCTYCSDWFEPTYLQLESRKQSIYGNVEGEGRVYCSNQCKQECPTYNQKLYPKGYKLSTSREVQPELRQLVMKKDKYICQKCHKHKDELEVGLHCHHIWPLNEDPVKSADIDECITLCKTCHKVVHKVPGCGYNEMRCNK